MNPKRAIPKGMSDNPERDGGYAVAAKPPSRFMNALSGGRLGEEAYETNTEYLRRAMDEDLRKKLQEDKDAFSMSEREAKFNQDIELENRRTQNKIKEEEARLDAANKAAARRFGLAGLYPEDKYPIGSLPAPLTVESMGEVYQGRLGKLLDEYGLSAAPEVSKRVRDKVVAETRSDNLMQNKLKTETEGQELMNSMSRRKLGAPMPITSGGLVEMPDKSLYSFDPYKIVNQDEQVTTPIKDPKTGQVLFNMPETLRKSVGTPSALKPISGPAPVSDDEITAATQKVGPQMDQATMRFIRALMMGGQGQ